MKWQDCPLSVFLVMSLFGSWAIGQQPAIVQSSATVPRLVNFSGKALNEQGKAVSGIVGATFAIYKDQSGGSPLWLETQNFRADAHGNYNVQLGSRQSQGLPQELFTSGEARWLGVQLDQQAEQPRVLLLSVPYALKASDAETVGGLPPSAFVLAAPARGSGEAKASPATASTASAEPPASSNVTTTGGTVNAVPLWTTKTNIQSSAISQTGSGTAAKIGIGTSSPATTLDVKGAGTIRGALTLPATGMATATGGKNSQPQDLVASSFNSSTSTAVNQTFQWQAEPAANNTGVPSGTLNLLYGLGKTKPAETGLLLSNKGLFTFANGQTFPGTVTGVTAGTGLTGGGTSGNLTLSLLTSCASGQVLQWNGSTWVCATPKNGTVTSVGLSAPSSDFTVSGSPITGSGTLGLGWNVPPTSGNTANAIVKRDSSGNFSGGSISAGAVSAITSVSGAAAVQGTSTDTIKGIGVYGKGRFAVQGDGTEIGVWGNGPVGVEGLGPVGVEGLGPVGVQGYGTTYGVAGFGQPQSGAYGVFGMSYESVGVWGASNSSDGVHGVSHSGGAAGVATLNDAGGDGILAVVTNGGFAGFFIGDVDVDGNLSKAGGSFKIDHPLDPADKYLYHSFVESPDMMNIYNGNVRTDAQGNAVVELPEWFETLNRDFRYQLTVIGTFAQAIVASEIANGSFSIKTDKPNVKVSWQVTGIRQDAWANAHRIPIEQVKPERERGFYLHPELFGAPEEKGIAWARHPEMMKRAKEKSPQPPPFTKH